MTDPRHPSADDGAARLDAAAATMFPGEVYTAVREAIDVLGSDLPATVHDRDMTIWHIAYRTLRAVNG